MPQVHVCSGDQPQGSGQKNIKGSVSTHAQAGKQQADALAWRKEGRGKRHIRHTQTRIQRERDTDRDTDRQRRKQTKTETDRQTERERERETHTHRNTQTTLTCVCLTFLAVAGPKHRNGCCVCAISSAWLAMHRQHRCPRLL